MITTLMPQLEVAAMHFAANVRRLPSRSLFAGLTSSMVAAKLGTAEILIHADLEGIEMGKIDLGNDLRSRWRPDRCIHPVGRWMGAGQLHRRYINLQNGFETDLWFGV